MKNYLLFCFIFSVFNETFQSMLFNSKNILSNVTDQELKISLTFKIDTETMAYLLNNTFDSLQIKLRKFNGKTDYSTILNGARLIIDKTKIVMFTNESLIYDQIEVFYNDRNQLNKITFRLFDYGNYILCYILMNTLDELISFHSTDMCVDIIVRQNDGTKPEQKYIYYKPLFIPIMYTLCALMLFPVVIWKSIVEKTKKHRRKKQKENASKNQVQELFNIESQITSTDLTISKNSQSCDKLITLSNINEESEEQETLLKVTNKSKFSLESDDNDDANSLNNDDDVADHILNSKPWLNSDELSPLTDSKSRELNLTNREIKSASAVEFKTCNSIIKKSRSFTSSSDKYKSSNFVDINKNKAKTISNNKSQYLLFESNV